MFARFVVAVCLSVVPWLACAQSKANDERSELRGQIFRLTSARDFAGIERLAADELSRQARFADGKWHVTFLYEYLSDAAEVQFVDEAAWQDALDRTRSLAKSRPAAWLMVAQLWEARSWQARGEGLAASVKETAWPAFKKYLAQSRDVLDEHKGELSANPVWYSARLRMVTGLDEGEALSQVIFDEGVKRFPSYHAIYFNRMRHVSPKWGGTRQQMLALMNQVARQGGPARQEALYARLAWFADESGYPIMHANGIDKEALLQDARMLVDAHPDQRNVQKMFFMACELGDRPLTESLFSKVSLPPIPEVWRRNLPMFDTCRDWATGKLKTFIIRVHDGDEVREVLVR